jgi:transcriptional regulator with XRE-family HTH domain
MPRKPNIPYRSTRKLQRPVHPIFIQLREHRLVQGLTMAEVAESAGYEKCALERIETGVLLPRMKTFFDICDRLGLEIRLVKKSDKRGDTE